ncbi:MAG TPA: peptidoglycan-binding protein, partial [Candidatus Binataceae bacterium]|nr:peptidoglycan-binding protein [Candidatus Binataceae bacterium]
MALSRPRIARALLLADVAIIALAIIALAVFGSRPVWASGASPVPSATPTLSPQGQQLQAMVHDGSLAALRWPNFSDYLGQVEMFYSSGGYALAWTEAGRLTSQATVMLEHLRHADVKGLNPEDYDASRWDARLAKLAPANRSPAAADLRDFDLAMTVSAMRFLSDLSIGRVNPHHVKFSVAIGMKKYDLADFLRQLVIHAEDVNRVIATAEPHYDGYARAETALATYTRLAAQGDGSPLPAVQKSVRPGGDYPGVPQLVARLRQLGDLAPDAQLPAGPTQYAGAIVKAVEHFQGRHGLDPDGVLGKSTIADLNVPLSQRVRQLQYALERYRWIPPAFAQPPIIVNLPEFVLRTMRRQPAPFLTMRVIVGKAYRKQTPVFTGNMQYVIFRPYWNVPLSIQQQELVPKLSRDRSYLATHGFEVVDGNQVVT